jgi:hypothetical protein
MILREWSMLGNNVVKPFHVPSEKQWNSCVFVYPTLMLNTQTMTFMLVFAHYSQILSIEIPYFEKW